MTKRNNGRKQDKPDPAVLDTFPIQSWPWPRIAVYVPLLPALPDAPRVFGRFWTIASQGVPLIDAGYGEIAMQRCKVGEHLMDSKYTHILMLDHDHLHKHNIIQQLASRVVEDPKRLIVGGLVFRRSAPYDPGMYLADKSGNYWQPTEWEHGLVEVDALSTACVLIHRSVFEHLTRPWFFYDYSGAEEGGPNWVRTTEDINFCKKARAAGIRIFVDTTICSPHIASDTPAVDQAYWQAYVAEHGYEEGKLSSVEEIIRDGEKVEA